MPNKPDLAHEEPFNACLSDGTVEMIANQCNGGKMIESLPGLSCEEGSDAGPSGSLNEIKQAKPCNEAPHTENIEEGMCNHLGRSSTPSFYR